MRSLLGVEFKHLFTLARDTARAGFPAEPATDRDVEDS